jgi:hypothetical protein
MRTCLGYHRRRIADVVEHVAEEYRAKVGRPQSSALADPHHVLIVLGPAGTDGRL